MEPYSTAVQLSSTKAFLSCKLLSQMWRQRKPIIAPCECM
ncbi:hypothetical protein FVEG_11898 [Fusarium verticillioides 7600]|uniref:Uncharacterized protein n=1 Tax=Gibberella moniliformis (strain M3125 / FGSC 7600) TaxID=334819 RepID=W7MQW5_GIBM7|nr:hypothetical protein FVEG_11898 [Fusarium verticillioides 7600]EWG53471.1 hypothetical protein FVEG_11898 [Fusarium verticillioides 7600]